MRTLPLLLLVACDPSSSIEDFVGGDFDFSTQAVSDGCLDGGFEVLFMPEGPGTPNPFGVPVYVPALDELPSEYEQALPDPFPAALVTVTGEGDLRSVSGAQVTDVEFDADTYPGCLVEAAVDVQLTLISADEVQGTATLTTGSFDEPGCPTPQADPCDLVVDLPGVRR